MKKLKNSNGYTLLLSLAIVIIFTVLGMSLIVLTSNGITKNTSRQNVVQSEDLSKKGMDFFVKTINNELTTFLSSSGKPRSAFAQQLNDVLAKYNCDVINTTDSKLQETTTGTATYCILGVPVDTIDSNGKVNDLRKLVTIKSLGEAGNKNSTLLSKVEIGASTMPDHLNYAVGTNKTGDGKDGEGNLIIHGGAEIKGDIKVEGNLITSSDGYGNLNWISSVLPTILPFDEEKSDHGNIVLFEKGYSVKNGPDYGSHIKKTDFSNTFYYTQKQNVAELFNPSPQPKIVTRKPVKTIINIQDQKTNFKYDQKSNNISTYIYDPKGIKKEDIVELSNIKSSNPSNPIKTFFAYQKYTEVCTGSGKKKVCNVVEDGLDYYKDYNLSGVNVFDSLSLNGSLILNKDKTDLLLNKNNKDNSGTLYVEKDLKIGNQVLNNNTSNAPNITIEGSFYVQGNVTITGANLSTNAIMYVDGDAKITYSTIKGKPLKDGKTGTLIIFATGDITISNNSVYLDAPSEITGFFYSEQNFEMYGAGSNIKINGGVSADRIVLNAIRGRSSNKKTNGLTEYGGMYFENSSTQAKKPSRLQIYYNPDIITTYSDLRQKEPIIYSINESIEKSREFK